MAQNTSINPEAPINAVIGDLTALYAAKSDNKLNKSIDYREFDAALKWRFNVNEFEINKHYTLYDDRNPGQNNFINTLEHLGWDVEKYRPCDVLTRAQFESKEKIDLRKHRFTSELNFWVGEADGSYDNLILITDQFAGLFRQVKQVIEADDRISVYVVCFRETLDSRYGSVENDRGNLVKIIYINDLINDFRNSPEYEEFKTRISNSSPNSEN
jgi:hypothetical protein